MFRLTPEKSGEIIVGVVIFGALIWLGETVFSMNGTLSALVTSASATANRVDHIASALPEIETRVAAEEIATPLRTVVVVAKPSQDPRGTWGTTVQVVDAETSQATSYSVALEGPDDPRVTYLVAGTALSNEKTAPSFAEMKRFSQKLKDTLMMPAWVDAHASFVLRETAPASYKAALATVESFRDSSSARLALTDVTTWHKLSAALQSISPPLPDTVHRRDSTRRHAKL